MRRESRNKKKTRQLYLESYQDPDVPRSFVIHQGAVSSNVKNLLSDFKAVMKPNTAEKLKARRNNTLKDFLAMAGPFKVTHMMMFSQTDIAVTFKVARLPQGPTLSFSVENYILRKDVLSSQKKNMVFKQQDIHAPCLITNLQPDEGEKHLQLCSKMFLDMFPKINPSQIKTKEIRRCCLLFYNETTFMFELRHYAIKLRPVGVSKATHKILSNKVPNLSSFQDVADFVTKAELLSGSEAEDDPSNNVIVNKKRKREVASQRSMIKLFELGPRLSLKLVKIEDGLCEGSVLYHSYIQLSAEEKLQIEMKKEQKRKIKRRRQKEQEKNVEMKKERKESHRQRCLQGMGIDPASLSISGKREHDDDEDDDDDAQYYREEVGEEPDDDVFKKIKKMPESSNKPKHRRYLKKKTSK